MIEFEGRRSSKIGTTPFRRVETGGGARTYLVDELETFLVGHALVGELNRVERKGGGRVEGHHAGDEEGRSLRERTDRKEECQRWLSRRVCFTDGRVADRRRATPPRARCSPVPVISSGYVWFASIATPASRFRRSRTGKRRVTGTRATC